MRQVSAAVILEDGRVLLGKRGAGGSCAYLWEFPGGKVELGESPADCLIRECREEVGLLVEPEELLNRVVYPFPDGPIELFFFKTRRLSGEAKPLVHTEILWVPVENLQDYPFSPANQEVLGIIAKQIP